MKLRESPNTTSGSLYAGCRVIGLASIASALLLVTGLPNAHAQSQSPDSLTVYVNTETFALNLNPGAGRVPLELSLDTLKGLNTSSEGLTPVTQYGVTRIDFKGRFRPAWVAVTDSQGKVRPFCITSLPAPVQVAARAVLKSQGVK